MFNPTFYPAQQSSDITLIGDRVKLKSLLILERSASQSSQYTFIFPSSAGSTGQALFWSGNETTFRGIAIADVATLETSLNSINSTLNSLGTAAFQTTSYFALSGHTHPDATTLISGFMSGGDKTKVDALGTASTKNTGTTNGTVPLIGAGNKLASSLIPDIDSTNNAAFTINADATNAGSDRSLILSTSNQTSSYTLALPPTVGTANQGLIIGSVSGSVVSLGWGSSGSGFSSVVSHSTASININLASGSMVAITLSQNTAIASITGIPSGSQGAEFTILCTQNSTGNYTLSFPSGTAVTGTISSTANSTSVIKVFSFDGGTSWDAIVIKPLPNTSTVNLWTPNNLTGGNKKWLCSDASETMFFGSGISQWDDKNNNGSYTQSTGSSQPTLVLNTLNNKPVVRFDGNDFLTSSYDISNIKTLAFVFRQNTNQANYIGMIGGSFICINNNHFVCLRKSNDASLIIDSTASSLGFNIYVYQIAPNNAFLRVNGTLINTDNSYNSFSGTMEIGGGGDAKPNGDLAELFTSENILSNTEIEKLEGYLASPQRSGLQSLLPSNHIYKNSAPTV